jgi:nicotinamidase-related amidase
MRARSQSPTAPDHDRGRDGAALLIIDVLNPFDFEGAQALKARAEKIVAPILALRDAADAASAPTIYINDNFGEWHSEKSKLIERARAGGSFVDRLAPRECDYFIIKPQLSAFYATNLPLLLPKLGVGRLVLTGIATDLCVLFTAGDAHMRDYSLWVPADSSTAASDAATRAAMTLMRRGFNAETAPTSKLPLESWIARMGDPTER